MKDNSDSGGKPTSPEYSVCVTTRNSIRTLEASLTSILSQLDERFEAVVVDSESTDGTFELLRRMQHEFSRLTVISHRCSRGRGRDMAYKASGGQYLIQQVDSDVVYKPSLHSILDYYHSMEKVYGHYSVYVYGAFLICSRDVMDRIGGWPDLQFAEDSYVYAKLSVISAFDYNRFHTDSAVKEHVRLTEAKKWRSLLTNGYVIWRDLHRVAPLRQAMVLLRLQQASERSRARKIGHVMLFAIGLLAQYTKPRYKLSGPELRNYIGAETSPNETMFYDLVREKRTSSQAASNAMTK